MLNALGNGRTHGDGIAFPAQPLSQSATLEIGAIQDKLVRKRRARTHEETQCIHKGFSQIKLRRSTPLREGREAERKSVSLFINLHAVHRFCRVFYFDPLLFGGLDYTRNALHFALPDDALPVEAMNLFLLKIRFPADCARANLRKKISWKILPQQRQRIKVCTEFFLQKFLCSEALFETQTVLILAGDGIRHLLPDQQRPLRICGYYPRGL